MNIQTFKLRSLWFLHIGPWLAQTKHLNRERFHLLQQRTTFRRSLVCVVLTTDDEGGASSTIVRHSNVGTFFLSLYPILTHCSVELACLTHYSLYPPILPYLPTHPQILQKENTHTHSLSFFCNL